MTIKDKKTETLSFKIDKNLKNRITQRALEEKRSTSNFVIKIITDYLEEVEKAKKLINN